MAAKWNDDTRSLWQGKGKDVCGDPLTEADRALKKDKENEAAETSCK